MELILRDGLRLVLEQRRALRAEQRGDPIDADGFHECHGQFS